MENSSNPHHLLWSNSIELDAYYNKNPDYDHYGNRYNWNYCDPNHFSSSPQESNNNAINHQQEQIPPTKRRYILKKILVIQFIGKSFFFRWNSEKIVKVSSEERKLTREEKRRRRRASIKYRTAHATRERMRVEAFNSAFGTLRQLLPTLPPDKKLSKIEILRLAICYIKYLDNVLKPELVDSGTSPNFQ